MTWSLEILPKYIHKLHLLPEIVKEVYIALMPGSDNQELVISSKALIEHGKIPIPHICARNLESEKELDRLLGGLKEIGVERALLIGGGADSSLGPYSCVMDILKTGLLSKHGFTKFDIAGHPEGNPNDPDADTSLMGKIEWASSNKFIVRIVTQWSIDPIAINSWIVRMRKLGIDNPIHIGVAGPAKTKTLLNYAKICGVKVSLMMLKKQGFNIMKLFMIGKPDHLVTQLKGYDQLHLFPFGGLMETSKWLTSINYESLGTEKVIKIP